MASRWSKVRKVRSVLGAVSAFNETLSACLVCFDLRPKSSGLVCPDHSAASTHLICKECLGDFVTSLRGTNELRRRDGGLWCCATDGVHEPSQFRRPTAFTREQVEPLLEGDALRIFTEELEPIPEESEHTRAVNEELIESLNITCPTCKQPIDPRPDGCIAIGRGPPNGCPRGCDAFCWLCQEVCGSDSHQHCMQAHGEYVRGRKVEL